MWLWCVTQVVAGHVTQRIKQYSPQSLSNVMWAFATQETHPGSATLDAVGFFVCKSLQVCHYSLTVPSGQAHHKLFPSNSASGNIQAKEVT